MARMPSEHDLGPIEGAAHRLEHDAASVMRHLAHPHLFRHDEATQIPAVRPVNLAVAAAAAPSHGGTMSLTTIADDLREDLSTAENGAITYIEGWIGRVKAAMPAIVSTVDTVSGSTVGKLAEELGAAVLPPEDEAALVQFAKFMRAKYEAAQAAAPAPAPVAPAAPVTAQ